MSHDELRQAIDKNLAHLNNIYGDNSDTVIAGERYGFISGLLADVLVKPTTMPPTTGSRVDRVLLHPVWGVLIFLGVMFGLFQFVFAAAAPLTDLIGRGFDSLAARAAVVSPAWLGSLLGDGVIGGVGSVISFVPNIFFLFIAISLLEDCGYLARVAFVMDRVMHRIGLHGRSFIPLILGFGCSIPAIMACRTIDNPRDRMTTMLITPFISCGARLPVFILLAGAFFTGNPGAVVFGLYALGIVVAIVTALIFRKTLFRGESGHFVMELPPYRMLTFRGTVIHMWERGKHFLQRAGTVIFAAVLIIWFLGYMPWGVEYASAGSWLGQIGNFVAPALAPAGFGQWPAATSLLSGFFAKETVVGSLGAIFGVEEGVLGGMLRAQLGWTPLVAFSFLVFTLLYTPCIAAIGTLRAESRSWKWPWFSIAYSTGVAWLAATLIYQIGHLAGIG